MILSKITRYNEIRVLLMNLKSHKTGVRPDAINESKEDLIIKSSIILTKLDWDSNKGREFLQSEFNVTSRQDLSKAQLLEFNMLLTDLFTRQTNSNKSIQTNK